MVDVGPLDPDWMPERAMGREATMVEWTPERETEETLRGFWRKAIYDLYDMVPRGQRPTARWRMSLATFDMVRKATEIDSSALGGSFYMAPRVPIKDYTLLGLPIDFDDAADGVTLCPVAARQPISV